MQRIIEVCLLVLLCRPDYDHCHGYVLGERLRGFGFDDSEISVSTLYRTLRGMEEAGWVKSSWAAGGPGPQRREYSVTDAGRAALDEWAGVLQKRRERIDMVLNAYAQLGRAPVVPEADAALQQKPAGKRRPNVIPKVDETQLETDMNEEIQTKSISKREAETLNEYWD
jgi:PadR family transcriptional regulator PadR